MKWIPMIPSHAEKMSAELPLFVRRTHADE
jgi:hypothetical protein